jgi:hypothetical protein
VIVGIPDPDCLIGLPEVAVGSIVIDIMLMNLPVRPCAVPRKLFADRIERRDLYLEFNFEHDGATPFICLDEDLI